MYKKSSIYLTLSLIGFMALGFYDMSGDIVGFNRGVQKPVVVWCAAGLSMTQTGPLLKQLDYAGYTQILVGNKKHYPEYLAHFEASYSSLKQLKQRVAECPVMVVSAKEKYVHKAQRKGWQSCLYCCVRHLEEKLKEL